jgi:hypothetical protein
LFISSQGRMMHLGAALRQVASGRKCIEHARSGPIS